MREQFPWFLDPTEEELQRLWEEATFSFDANVLLNLYRVDRETTEDYFKIFRALGDRIFLPHEAANQFFLNRRKVIRTEQNSFSEAKKRVRDWVERRTGFDNLKQQLRGGDIGQIIEDEIESVFENREGYDEEVEAVKDDLIERIEDLEERFTPTGTTRANAEEDEILAGLMEIFDGKTGEPLNEDMENLKDKAKKRYKSEQPPGYLDYNEDEEDMSRGECEDFIIWKQLMEFAEREGEDVVFVTGEKKEDWWEVDDEHKIVRPGHELLREFGRRTERSFWMLTTDDALENAYERLGVEVRDKSVEQTKTIRTDDIEMGRGIDYYLSPKEIEAQKIKEHINKINKFFYRTKETIANIEEYEKGRIKRLYENLSLLSSNVRTVVSKYEEIDNVYKGAVEVATDEIKEKVSSGKIEEAREISESLSHHVSEVKEKLLKRISELKKGS